MTAVIGRTWPACNAVTNMMLSELLTSQDFVDTSGHGKLLVDESIFPLAYATNVNEQVLEVPC